MKDHEQVYDEWGELWGDGHAQKGTASKQPQDSDRQKRLAQDTGERAPVKDSKPVCHKKRRQKQVYAVCVAGLILLILAIILICRACPASNEAVLLEGSWRYDEHTVYEFDRTGTGCMCLNNEDHYEFTYQIEGHTLKFDYVLDRVIDCEYTFSVNGEKLTLIGGQGTAEIGKKYELTKE